MNLQEIENKLENFGIEHVIASLKKSNVLLEYYGELPLDKQTKFVTELLTAFCHLEKLNEIKDEIIIKKS